MWASVMLPRLSRRSGEGDLARLPRRVLVHQPRLERGRFIWPAASDVVVTISPAQLGYLLSGSTGDILRRRGGRRRWAGVELCGAGGGARSAAGGRGDGGVGAG